MMFSSSLFYFDTLACQSYLAFSSISIFLLVIFSCLSFNLINSASLAYSLSILNLSNSSASSINLVSSSTLYFYRKAFAFFLSSILFCLISLISFLRISAYLSSSSLILYFSAFSAAILAFSSSIILNFSISSFNLFSSIALCLASARALFSS